MYEFNETLWNIKDSKNKLKLIDKKLRKKRDDYEMELEISKKRLVKLIEISKMQECLDKKIKELKN